MNEQHIDPSEGVNPAASELASDVSFTTAQQIEFTRKEIRETLRDRRTIVTLMVMP